MLKRLNKTQNDFVVKYDAYNETLKCSISYKCDNYNDIVSCSGGFSCDNKAECVFCDKRDSCSSCDKEWCHPFVRDKD